MNAAFVIVASALLGNHPAAAPCSNCAPAPAATCDSCGPTVGHSLRGRFSGLFSGHGCGCKTSNPCPTPCPAPAPACETPCNACGGGHGSGGFFGKLRGGFGHHNRGCDCAAAPACDGCSAPAAAPATGGEVIKDAPKKMPDAPKGDAPKSLPKADAPKGDKAVRYDEPPADQPLAIPSVNPLVNTRPNLIVAPATLRNPF